MGRKVRASVERLIAQLVKVRHRGARRVTANPGDWGLDIIVGELTEDAQAMAIWQAKFFIDGVEATQQRSDPRRAEAGYGQGQ